MDLSSVFERHLFRNKTGSRKEKVHVVWVTNVTSTRLVWNIYQHAQHLHSEKEGNILCTLYDYVCRNWLNLWNRRAWSQYSDKYNIAKNEVGLYLYYNIRDISFPICFPRGKGKFKELYFPAWSTSVLHKNVPTVCMKVWYCDVSSYCQQMAKYEDLYNDILFPWLFNTL